MLLLAVASLAAAQDYYVIDSVCVGANRYYRIDGEKGSTYDWHLKDTITGNEITIPNPAGTAFTDVRSPGDTIWGSEVNILWDNPGIYLLYTYHYSFFGCDTLEQGLVKVYEAPAAVAGLDQTVCLAEPILLTGDTAMNYSRLEWATRGDGTFDATDRLHPIYYPGTNDSISGSVTLLLTAYGLAENSTCTPAVDSVTFLFSNPEITFNVNNVLCFNESSAWVKAEVTDGTPPYSFDWTGPDGFTSTDDSISNLITGAYILTITDANGCTNIDSVAVTQPEELIALIDSVGHVRCYEGNDGMARATASGGTGSLSYEWNTVPVQNTPVATNLSAGEYIVTVTDENGCVATDTVEVLQPDELIAIIDSVGNVNCFGGDDGFARVSVLGGTAGFSYEWNTVPVQDSSVALNLTAGEYSVIVTDSLGCVAWDTIQITEPDSLVLTAIAIESRCNGNKPGSIDLTVSGGTPYPTAPYYEYEWRDSTGIIATTEDLSGLAGDMLYTVVVKDANGCLDSLEVFIDEEKNINLALTVDSVNCFGESTWAIHTVVSQGKKPYTYKWNTGDNSAELIDISAGFYRVTVEDDWGCTATDSVLLVDPPLLVAGITPDSAEICEGDVIQMNGNPAGGTGVYTHLWSGTGATHLSAVDIVDPVFSGAPAGVYELIYAVTDENGCFAGDTVSVTVWPNTYSVTDTFLCAPELPFVWNDSTYTAFGTYTNVIPNAAGCDSVMTLNIFELPATASVTDTFICAPELPFVWNDSTYTAFGTYTNIIPNAAGCDSVMTLNIYELPATTSVTDTFICAPELPFVWNDSTYTAFGTYTNVIPNAAGCDSVMTLNIYELPATTSVTDTFICAPELPFVWNDSTYTAFGTYTNVIPNAAGCDSVMTLNIYELPATTSVTDTFICAPELPIIWNDSTYTAFGTYTNVIPNAAGCDSVMTLNIYELPATTSVTDTFICAPELPFVWNDSTYTAFGTYTNVIPNAAGCDSVMTLNIYELPATTSVTDTFICAPELPFVWNDSTYTAFGTYTNVIPNAAGCDSVMTLNIYELPATTSVTDTFICAPELPFVWNDSTYTAFGTYTNVIPNAAGCDSVMTLNIYELPATTSVTDTFICAPELPFVWNDSTYTAFGTYTNVIPNAAGCDSVMTLNIYELPATTSVTDTFICSPELPFVWNDSTYTAFGTYTNIIPNAAGCDSVMTLNIYELPATTSVTDTFICAPELPIVWNDSTYTAFGTYTNVIPNAAGCDSVMTLNIYELPATTSVTDTFICSPELPFVWNDSTYTAFGTYTNVIPNAAGCDSVMTLNIYELPATTSVTDTFICAPEFPIVWNDSTYTAFGTYTNIIPNAAGCDSVMTLNIYELPATTSVTDTFICAPELPFVWNDSTYTAFGTYTNVIPNAAGCDSVMTLNIYELPATTSVTDTFICAPELPIVWNDSTYTAFGTYTNVIPNAAGCDSVMTLNIYELPATTSVTDTFICAPELPFVWNDSTYTAFGTYTNIIPNAAGCDSVMTLNIYELPATTSVTDTFICSPELPIVWNDSTYTAFGTYTNIIPNTTGCDSVMTLNIYELPATTSVTDTFICAPELPFVWNDSTYTAFGTYTNIIPNAAGCDSVMTLNIYELPATTSVTDTFICAPELPIIWNDSTYTAFGTYTNVIPNAAGCDSVMTLNIYELPATTSVTDTFICAPELPIVWNDSTYTAFGTYTNVIPNAAGCDSVMTLNIYELPATTSVTDTFICSPELPFVWNDSTYTAFGTYTNIIPNAAGCDSVMTLNIYELPATTSVTDTFICSPDLPFVWNDSTYTAFGTYTNIIPNAAGCDSVMTLNIYELPATTSVTDTFICAPELPFVWNDSTYTAFGTYTNIIPNAAGCDSVMTLNIYELPATTSVTDTFICSPELPFVWNDSTYTAFGTYTNVIPNAAGCDSVMTLNIYELPATTSVTDTFICAPEFPIVWNDSTYTAFGTYTNIIPNAAGCDSVMTLNIYELPATTSVTDTFICAPELPFVWNDSTYTAFGTYTNIIPNAAGCDSVMTLNIYELPATTSVTDTFICAPELPFVWNDSTYTAFGTYTNIIPNAAGCDSVMTLNIFELPATTSVTDTFICAPELPFVWNDSTYTDFGTYTNIIPNAAGCDSVMTLNIYELPATTSVTDTFICSPELPFVWNDSTYTAFGTYTNVIPNAAGCDSVMTLNIYELPATTSVTDTFICAPDLPFVWNDSTYTAFGTYTNVIPNAAGCDSVMTLNIYELPATTSVTDTFICAPEFPIVWNDSTYTAFGTYTNIIPNAAGCDSVMTLNIYELPATTSVTDTFICAPEFPIVWNDSTYTAFGTYTNIIPNAAGCDSVMTLNIYELPATTSVTDTFICAPDLPFVWNDSTYTAFGTYTNIIPNAAGCDSVMTLNIYELPATTSVTDTFICSPELPFVWNDSTYTAFGTYTNIIPNAAGCDSVMTLNIYELPATTSVTDTFICAPEFPIVWNDSTYTAFGTYTNIIPNAAGCDSVMTLNIYELPATTSVTDTFICAPELPFVWNDSTYTAFGTYTNVIPNAAGCDSVMTLNIYELPATTSTSDTTLCEGAPSFIWNSQTITTDHDSIYQETLTNAAGCDSLLMLNVTVLPTTMSASDTTLCKGAPSFVWNSQVVTSDHDSIYQETLVNAQGCDSLLTLNVHIITGTFAEVFESACDSFIWVAGDGNTYYNSGIYDYISVNANGCDDTLRLNLTVLPGVDVSVAIAADKTDVIEGEQVTLTATPDNGGTNPVYVWFVNGVEVPGETTATYTYTPEDGDEVYVTLTSDLDCASPVPAVSNIVVITLLPPAIITVVPDVTHVECYGYSTGAIELTVSDGTEPYNYVWSNGETTRDIYGLAAGIYTVTVTDLVNTTETISIEVTEPDSLKLTFTKVDVDGSPDPIGSIDLTVTGGTGPYTYEWMGPNGFTSTDEDINNLETGNYNVFVTDANACTELLSVTIAGYGMSCPPLIVIDCGLDEMPAPYATLAEYEAAGGFAQSTYDLVEESFTQVGADVSDGETCPETITRKYSIENVNGDIMTCEQLLIIRDVTPPAMTVTRKTFQCRGDIPAVYTNITQFRANGGYAEDECLLDESSFRITGESTGGSCPETIVRFYEVKDMCGNAAEAREIIVIDDKIPPRVYRAPDDILTDCLIPQPYLNYNEFVAAGGFVIENCDVFTMEYIGDSEPTGDGCPTTIIRTYRFTDNCDNYADYEQKIIINDTIPPVISCPDNVSFNATIDDLESLTGLPLSETEQQISLADTTALGISVFDNCEMEVTYRDEVTGSCPSFITRTFTVYDGCSNFDLCTQQIEMLLVANPEFDPIGPLCQNTIPPALPDVSLNGISGTWDPAIIETSVTGIFTYTFTPDPDECASVFTMEIEIVDEIIPVFVQIGPLCVDAVPPPLPTVSTNGITGTWNPSVIETSAIGVFTYTFTPDNGQCAVPVTMEIEITDEIIPEFDPLGPFCVGAVPPPLPTVSVNGITGTWNPSAIETSVAGVFSYTFTPDGNTCAVPFTMEIEITEYIVPVFDPIGPICQFDTPPLLPATDLNGITGTWSPDVISTDVPGFYDFVFTPDGSYECAESVTITVEINTVIIPQFNTIDPMCQYEEPPSLPVANFNGVTGSWNPSEISTDEPGIFPYVFTPDAGFHCAYTDTIFVEVLPQVVPEFDPIGPLCIDEVPPSLPDTDINGITGTWLPDTIITSVPGIFELVFTPEAGIDCAINDTLVVVVKNNTPPDAVDDNVITQQDEPVDVSVLANDSDPGGALDTTSLIVVSQPSYGTAIVSPVTGIIEYTPDTGFFGYDTLTYAVCDNGVPCGPMCDTAQVIIDVKEPNNPPVAVNDSFTVMCYPLIEYLLNNDYDPDGDNLQIITWPMLDVQHGTVTIENDGAFIYMPDEGFVGVDSFIYRVCDDGFPMLCDEALVWINVLPEADCGGLPGDEDDIDTECALFIPEGFSPNGDGVHDFFQVYCIEKYPNAIMRIFDRAGNKLFEKHNYGNMDYWGSDENAWWWGTSENRRILGRGTLPAGTYLYVFELGTGEVRTGTVMIAY